MLGPNPLPNEQPSLPWQLETDRTASSGEVASRSNSRFLWTGFGFAVLMLIGVSACALLPIAFHRSATFSRHVPSAAFILSLPALAPERIRPAITDIRNLPKVANLGPMTGSLRRSNPVMSSVLDRPMAGGSRSAVLDRPAPNPQLQYASPPSPPPARGGGGGGGDSDDDWGGSVLKRYSAPEAVTILDAWIARVKVYCLSSQFDDPEGRAPVHRATLQQLESFRSFVLTPPGADEKKVLYGLYNLDGAGDITADEKVLAIAGGLTSSDMKVLATADEKVLAMDRNFLTVPTGETVKIKYLSANPKDLRKPSDFALPALKAALANVADPLHIGLVIDIERSDS